MGRATPLRDAPQYEGTIRCLGYSGCSGCSRHSWCSRCSPCTGLEEGRHLVVHVEHLEHVEHPEPPRVPRAPDHPHEEQLVPGPLDLSHSACALAVFPLMKSAFLESK